MKHMAQVGNLSHGNVRALQSRMTKPAMIARMKANAINPKIDPDRDVWYEDAEPIGAGTKLFNITALDLQPSPKRTNWRAVLGVATIVAFFAIWTAFAVWWFVR